MFHRVYSRFGFFTNRGILSGVRDRGIHTEKVIDRGSPFIQPGRRPQARVAQWGRPDPLKAILSRRQSLSEEEFSRLKSLFEPSSSLGVMMTINMDELTADDQKKAVVVADLEFPSALITMRFANFQYTLGPSDAIMSINVLRQLVLNNLRRPVLECIQAGFSCAESQDNRQHLNPWAG